jgi:hypothetical protein
MINLSKVDKNYYRCNSCLGTEDILNISYSANDMSTSSFRLCKWCRSLLVKLLIGNLESEVDDNE